MLAGDVRVDKGPSRLARLLHKNKDSLESIESVRSGLWVRFWTRESKIWIRELGSSPKNRSFGVESKKKNGLNYKYIKRLIHYISSQNDIYAEKNC